MAYDTGAWWDVNGISDQIDAVREVCDFAASVGDERLLDGLRIIVHSVSLRTGISNGSKGGDRKVFVLWLLLREVLATCIGKAASVGVGQKRAIRGDRLASSIFIDVPGNISLADQT